MYAYLKGSLTYKSPTQVYLDINGVGYNVLITLNTFSKIENFDTVKLFTYVHVREDVLDIYGFENESEKEIFLHLLSVSGIGPNTARVVLSSMTPQEVSTAILQDNAAAFNKVKGIGPKTAKRLILDLKDKIAKIEIDQGSSVYFELSNYKMEAVSALQALGFNKAQVSKKIDQILSQNPEINQVEDIIKEVLKQMS